MTKKILVIIGSIICILCVVYFVSTKKNSVESNQILVNTTTNSDVRSYLQTLPQIQDNNQKINMLGSREMYVGKISTSTNGMMLYVNEILKLSFLFPRGWRVGDNHIVDGTFQILNYSDTKDGKDFSPNAKTNKIETTVLRKSYFQDEPSNDYPELSRKTEIVQVGGQDIFKKDIILVGGQQFRTYVIPIPSTNKELLLTTTVYGNPNNFYILDKLVESIKWLK